ncbi:MAG TPA: endolytic transglycosylase MltG [Phenylobacterium sp.]|nr:endolytic transglycosylase MltG [Phenylobacterium sp.]HQN49926.1 endolytic transglycosylase MltG [Phenylobacterium sp.]
MAALMWAVWTYQGPGPAAKAGDVTTVELRRGASLPEIASTLERAGVVRSSAIFIAAAQATGAARQMKAGEYEVPSKASMARILDDIRHGRIVKHQVTIAEGLTSEMVVEILAKKSDLTGEAPAPAEGSILPETYQYERGEDRAKVLKRMMDARDELLATLWARRQPGLPFTTPMEAVTLASIVEKETGKASERPRVAAVFLNRLRSGMRLQSDPTIIYGITGGRPLGRGIRASELAQATPYNTYQIDGLPPTPIANPGRAAIAAVLDPPKTDELYFVADGTGGHVFASTLEQHNANVARWRNVERQRAASSGGEGLDGAVDASKVKAEP